MLLPGLPGFFPFSLPLRLFYSSPFVHPHCLLLSSVLSPATITHPQCACRRLCICRRSPLPSPSQSHDNNLATDRHHPTSLNTPTSLVDPRPVLSPTPLSTAFPYLAPRLLSLCLRGVTCSHTNSAIPAIVVEVGDTLVCAAPGIGVHGFPSARVDLW